MNQHKAIRVIMFICIIALAGCTVVAQAPEVRIACAAMTLLACIRYITFNGGNQ